MHFLYPQHSTPHIRTIYLHCTYTHKNTHTDTQNTARELQQINQLINSWFISWRRPGYFCRLGTETLASSPVRSEWEEVGARNFHLAKRHPHQCTLHVRRRWEAPKEQPSCCSKTALQQKYLWCLYTKSGSASDILLLSALRIFDVFGALSRHYWMALMLSPHNSARSCWYSAQ